MIFGKKGAAAARDGQTALQADLQGEINSQAPSAFNPGDHQSRAQE